MTIVLIVWGVAFSAVIIWNIIGAIAVTVRLLEGRRQ